MNVNFTSLKKNLKKNLNQENSLKFLTGTEIIPGT